jgi:hypothetical protein
MDSDKVIVVGVYPDGRIKLRAPSGQEKAVSLADAVAFHKKFGLANAKAVKGKLVGTPVKLPRLNATGEVVRGNRVVRRVSKAEYLDYARNNRSWKERFEHYKKQGNVAMPATLDEYIENTLAHYRYKYRGRGLCYALVLDGDKTHISFGYLEDPEEYDELEHDDEFYCCC